MNCQQGTIYAAEQDWVWKGGKFTDLDAVQKVLDGMRDTWWWIKWLNEDIKRIEVGRGRRSQTVGGVGWYEREHLAGRLEFSVKQPTTRVVIHEMAHVVASARRGSKSHDPWFARVYLELVYLILGTEAFIELYTRFERHGVDFDAAGITDWTRGTR